MRTGTEHVTGKKYQAGPGLEPLSSSLLLYLFKDS